MRSSKVKWGSVIKWMIGVSIALIFLFLFYVYFFQLIFGNPFVPYFEREGLQYYTSGEIYTYEKGSIFVEQFFLYDFAEQCQVKNFYYTDTKTFDSIVYGKRPDVYAFDLDSGSHYETIKQKIIEAGEFCGSKCSHGGLLTYYLMPSDSGSVTDRFVFAVAEGGEKLIFFLITEMTDEDISQLGHPVASAIHYWGCGIDFLWD